MRNDDKTIRDALRLDRRKAATHPLRTRLTEPKKRVSGLKFSRQSKSNYLTRLENAMDEHRATGTAKSVGGKVEESFGRIAGDVQAQAKGQAKQLQGAAEDLYGQAVDAAGGVVDTVQNVIERRAPILQSLSRLVWAGCWGECIDRFNRLDAAICQHGRPRPRSEILRPGPRQWSPRDAPRLAR